MFINCGTFLSDKMTVLPRNYLAGYIPTYWLFEGKDGGQYSNSSIQKIFRRAVLKAKVTPYSTLHSFTTHLLKCGMDLRYIQEFGGIVVVVKQPRFTFILLGNPNRNLAVPLDHLAVGENNRLGSEPEDA